MSDRPVLNQTSSSIEKNSSFFRENMDSYSSNVAQLDTYAAIKRSINEAIKGIKQLMDIENRQCS